MKFDSHTSFGEKTPWYFDSNSDYIVPARKYVVQKFQNGRWINKSVPLTMDSAKLARKFESDLSTYFTKDGSPTRILFVG